MAFEPFLGGFFQNQIAGCSVKRLSSSLASAI
jgi:hypothetical protein